MPLHVWIFERFSKERSSGLNRGTPYAFLNLSENDLKTRVVERWDRGEGMTWGGETAESPRSKVQVFRTDAEISGETPFSERYALMSAGEDVTNEWITGPAGARAASISTEIAVSEESPLRDHSRVMVVYGRNLRARDAMFTFLRTLGLSPIEWEQAIAETGVASPHNLDAVRTAMDVGQAVVVILTAEDKAGLLPELAGPSDSDDLSLRGQPRQNVILEAGLAMGVDRRRVILVELGEIRRASDFDGLNVVRLTNAAPTRSALRSRLQGADCAVDESASDWIRPEAAGDFEACVIPWAPELAAPSSG